MPPPDLVVVISGGLSFEREISIRSGNQVADALRDGGMDVMTLDIEPGMLETLATLSNRTVAFMALHGPVGEDGVLQDLLDASRIPYVGSRGDASRLAYNKPIAKYIIQRHGISTPAYAALSERMFHDLGAEFLLDRFSQHFGYPLVVKPTRGGSAFGLSIVKDHTELPQAMIRCFNHARTALLERYIQGTEVAVGVIGDKDALTVLPPVEIVPVRGIYDFEARYNPGQTEFFIPARLPKEVLDNLSAVTRTIHTTLGLRHISRSDFIVDDRGRPQFIEVTASPSLSETSVVQFAMRAIGLAPSQVFVDLADAALTDSTIDFRTNGGSN